MNKHKILLAVSLAISKVVQSYKNIKLYKKDYELDFVVYYDLVCDKLEFELANLSDNLRLDALYMIDYAFNNEIK